MSSDGAALPSVDEQREDLAATGFRAAVPLRVLFVGRFANGATDIVAAMLRSLRELGHDVVHVDPTTHPGVLPDPGQYRGGFGPVHVDLDALEPVLARHRPHVLVLCAGGMVLRPEQADRLAERGVLSLGMTLSDPDVKPSVVDHVDAFDWHTTNAGLALGEYLAGGLERTSLFGFGIDRAFAVQHVAPAPDLRHDVICVGHAWNRPDRNAAMSRLAETLDVAVYGNGWELPSGGAVAGSRLVQAMREGAVHVNFPATRAGFVNVKCGVFESVAAGGVVATQTFPEMERYFGYGQEVLGHSDVDALVDGVRGLVGDRDALESMRRAAFSRLVREHLYERRWADLFEHLLSGPLPGSDDRTGRIAAWRERVSRDPVTTTRRVVVAGWYGAGNVGDDLLLESIAGALEPAGVAVEVVGHDVAAVLRRHGLPGAARPDMPQVEQMLGRSDALVMGGGGLFQDYTFRRNRGIAGTFTSPHGSPNSLLALAVTARVLRRPVHVYGIGAGPLADPDARDVVGCIAELATSVDVRDEESAGLVRDVAPGPGTEVDSHPDPVYALRTTPVPARIRAGAVAVNARPWAASPEGFRPALVAALRGLVEGGERLVGLPMAPEDVQETADLLREVTGEAEPPMIGLDGSTDELVADIGVCRLVVAMRLHACLLAHRERRPVVGLAYDPKVRRHFEELGRGAFVLDLQAVAAGGADALPGVLDAALAEGGGLPVDVRHEVARREAGAREGLAALVQRVVGRPPARRRAETIHFPPPSRDRPSAAPTRPAQPDPTVLPVGSAEVVVGSTSDVDRTPEVVRTSVRGSVRLHLADSAPLGGDYAGLVFDVGAGAGTAVRCEVVLQCTFAERRARRGRMAVQLLVDGAVRWAEDVAGWDERLTVWLAWTPPADGSRIEVRTTALRDCEDWSWGRAGAVLVHSVRVLPWSGEPGDEVLVGAGHPVPPPGPAGAGERSA